MESLMLRLKWMQMQARCHASKRATARNDSAKSLSPSAFNAPSQHQHRLDSTSLKPHRRDTIGADISPTATLRVVEPRHALNTELDHQLLQFSPKPARQWPLTTPLSVPPSLKTPSLPFFSATFSRSLVL